MSQKLLETLLSALIGGMASVAVAVVQARVSRRWAREEKALPAPDKENR